MTCGVDLPLAAKAMGDSLATMNFREYTFVPELLVPRLGEHMIEEGLIKEAQLAKALKHQQRQAEGGRALLIGQVLVELGFLNQRSLDFAVTKQIYFLQEELQKSNRELEKRVEQRTASLREAFDKFAELEQFKSKFVDNLSHDLRTPLTPLKGYLELLMGGRMGELPREVTHAHKIMHEACTQLEEMVEELIKFSDSSKGQLSLDKAPIQIQQIIKDAVAKSAQKAVERSIVIDTSVAEDLPPVVADRENITWVVRQLLDNAIKFSSSGGIVTITAIPRGDSRISITVADTGVGMERGEIEKALKTFHQLDSFLTEPTRGKGLGLALVRRIVEAHESSIEVSSVVGQGSRFSFSLPSASGSASDER
jgi:signal transduction histidine kinase